METPDISVVIVNYNTEKEIGLALESLRQHSAGVKTEVIVVDNSSQDGSVEYIEATFPETRLIKNPENRGFATANNQGFALAKAPFILMLNPDAYLVDDSTLKTMLDFMKAHPDSAAVAPNLIYPDGSWQHSLRKFPTPLRILCAQLALDKFIRGVPHLTDYYLPESEHKETREADQPMGACLLLRKSVLDEIGCLDERFFVYFEEVDWLKRAKEAGYKIYFLGDATVAHIANTASNRFFIEGQEYFHQSLISYFRKHYGKEGELWIKWALVAASPVRIASLIWRGASGKLPPKAALKLAATYYLFLAKLLFK
ncbi:MAG: glycosyltransferase family 2 protein [Myxococcota bacterium]